MVVAFLDDYPVLVAFSFQDACLVEAHAVVVEDGDCCLGVKPF